MILLLCSSNLDEWKHEYSRGEVDLGGWCDTSHILENIWVLALDLLVVDSNWVEAVINIVISSVASYLIGKEM